MSGLAEQEINQSPARVWAGRVALVGGIAAALGLGAWLLSGMSAKVSSPKKQTVAIKVLPDTPPPPPPPKPEDKPPPPKEEPKQVMQMEAPKVQAPVDNQPQQLKMEGPAGDGPSAFAGGSITKDYVGGPVGDGTGGTGTQSSRAQYKFFINTARQQLKDQLERNLSSAERQITAEFSIWLSPAGEIQRYEVAPTGKSDVDSQVKSALSQTARDLKLPPPPGLPQPLKFRLTLQPLG
ncbi:TonB C-terminal domain-containing protein [Aquabacterium sp.]|uniref:TonB C-terminal domain-containing protein n=1 Tax=Aquabacterium sp. TaxID=1872578 RepID=UPI0035AECAE0